jgi:hypothetical protein
MKTGITGPIAQPGKQDLKGLPGMPNGFNRTPPLNLDGNLLFVTPCQQP